MDAKKDFIADEDDTDRFSLKPGPAINTRGLSAEENRGRRAPQEGSGVVIGSGASAGGGGGAEDFDSDSACGDGPPRPIVRR